MLQTFLNTANVPIFGIDLQGRVNEWNKEAAEISGYSREEVLGKYLVGMRGFSSIDEVFANALRGQGTENFECMLYTKNLRRRDLLLNATTWRDVDGTTTIGVIGVAQDITERKKIECEKARIVLELQNLIDTANAPIFGINFKGSINEWNNKSTAITGFTREEVLDKNLVENFIMPEFQKSVKEVLDLALQGRETANFEFPLFTKDRRRVEVLLNATTRRDVNGAVIGVIGVGQDVTERKRAELEKTRVVQELQTFIDTANAPIFGIDANGLVNEWNNKAAAITGFSRQEVLGRNLVQDFITKEYQMSVKEVLDKSLQGQVTANFEFPLYSKDNRRMEVLLSTTTRRDINSTVVGVIGVGQDITERNQVEMEKARVDQGLQTFIDTANAPILGIDAYGLVNEWNNKSAAITGFSRSQVLGKNLVEELVTEEYREGIKVLMNNALQGHETANFKLPLFTQDQRWVEVLLNATTRRDMSGHVIGVLGVGLDITDWKQVEIERERVAQELQTFIDAANAPIILTPPTPPSANGMVIALNNKSTAVTGFCRQEVLGINLVQNYVTKANQVSVKEVLNNTLRGHETANFMLKDHCRVNLLLKTTTPRDVRGKIVGVLSQDLTERKAVETVKTKVASKFDTAFALDANGLVKERDIKSATITRFSREVELGKNFMQDFFIQESIKSTSSPTIEHQVDLKDVLEIAGNGYETSNFEFPLHSTDKRRVDVLLNATTRRDVSGNVVGVLGVGQDITERKQVEMEKARVVQELQTFIDTANAPIFGIDANGLVNEWNNKATEITGFSKREVLGKDLVEVYITKEFRASVRQVLDKALSGIETANFEFPLFCNDQSRRLEVLLNATTRRDVTGRIVGVIGVGQDVTERKRVEMEKTRVAQELQTFIDTANAPIFGIDACGLVNEWNNKAAVITGFSCKEVLGRNLIQDFITKEYQVNVKEVLDRALQGRETANFEFPLYTKDMRRVDVLLNATTRRDVSGHVIGVIGVGQDITERKQVEMEKARVAQELQTFIDTANAPIFGIDARGLVNEWNNKAAEITGFSREEVLGRNLVQDFITKEYQVSVKEVLDNALRERETANFEFPLYTTDKRRVDVLLNATTRRDVSGNVVGVLGVGQDITERKQVEMEKARVVQELQTFIDTANAPIFGIDANGLVNEWNNKAAEITGFSKREVLGKDLVEVYITKEFRASVRQVLDKALSGIETANFEFPLFCNDQSRRLEVLLNATTRRDVTGRIVGVIGVGQDVTERKRVEMEKTRVGQELQTFIDTANAPIFGIDACGLVNEWNNKAALITGFSKLEVMGQNLVEVYITEEFRASVREVFCNALHGVEKSNFEFPLFTKDKRRTEVLLNATTRRDVTGAIVGVIGVGQDITAMRRLMEQETLLLQAQAANDAKSQFLATMSHEMRTPLNVIMGMNQLVMDSQLTAEQRKFTQQIKSSSESLLLLVDDILDLAKIEGGKLELVPVEFDLRAALEDAVESMSGRATAKGLDIHSYLDPVIPTRIIGDPDRLRQILLNLFSNGIKFTDAGQVHVEVELDEVTAIQQTFRFKVYDSGIGISVEGQKKLFNRFSQVDSSTTRTYGGTGLGLAISKQFAELMDGFMGVQSEVGKGSLFWFTAVFKRAFTNPSTAPPAAPCHTLGRPPTGAAAAGVPSPLSPFPPLRHAVATLLVARNETLRLKLLRYLESFGLHPTGVVCFEDTAAEAASTNSNCGGGGGILGCGDSGEFDLIIVCTDIVSPLQHTSCRGGEGGEGVDDSWPCRLGSSADGVGDPMVDTLDSTMRSLAAVLKRRPAARSLVLCPNTQIHQCTAHREALGGAFTLLTRPVRLACFHRALADAVDHLTCPAPSADPRRLDESLTSAELATECHFSWAAAPGGEAGSEKAGLWDLRPGVSGGGSGSWSRGVGKGGLMAKMVVPRGGASSRSQAAGAQRKRILVVDDDAGQRMVVKMMLTREGYEVDVAEDGAHAVKATKHVAYDAVLMDGFMPIKTGWDATREIRLREAAVGFAAGDGRALIIIGVTGATSSEDARKCMECGMTDYITKPVARPAIHAKICYWLERMGRIPVVAVVTAASSGSGNSVAGMSNSYCALADLAANKFSASESEPARAACPLPSVVSSTSALAAVSLTEATGAASAGTPKRVLVMTDAGQRTILRAMLQQLGSSVPGVCGGATVGVKDKGKGWLEVDVAVDAAAAVAAVAARNYHLYLIDVEMSFPAATAPSSSSMVVASPSVASAARIGVSAYQLLRQIRKAEEAATTVTPPFLCDGVGQGPTRMLAPAVSISSRRVSAKATAAGEVLSSVDGGTLPARVLMGWNCSGVGGNGGKDGEDGCCRMEDGGGSVEQFAAVLYKPLQRDAVHATLRSLLFQPIFTPPAATVPPSHLSLSCSFTLATPKLEVVAQPGSIHPSKQAQYFDAAGLGVLALPIVGINGGSWVLNGAGDSYEVGAVAGHSSLSPEAKEKRGELKAARILIVEDHWANRKLLESMVRKQGYLSELVENGLEAVQITAARPYDLILMDCNMPIMDGWQATERIRERPGLNQRTPIVAVTANAMKGDREKCMTAGMDDYISKPVDRGLLYKTLAKWAFSA